jgi:hypothetical protein
VKPAEILVSMPLSEEREEREGEIEGEGGEGKE